jgi:hypothetical protein
MRSGCEKVWRALRAILNEKAPFEHDIFADGENPSIEHRAYPVSKPRIQFSAEPCVSDNLDSEADLGERNGADVQTIERLCGDER